MKPHFRAQALLAIFCVFGSLQEAAAQEDYARQLVRSLGLVKIQRVVLKRFSASEPRLGDCFDRVATDARLEADLLPVIVRSFPNGQSAHPVLAFLATPPGRKYAAAVERREPEFKPPLRRPIILPGGIPMSGDEIRPDEVREIENFLRSSQGAPLLGILKETTGFAQLTRALGQRQALATECGISVK